MARRGGRRPGSNSIERPLTARQLERRVALLLRRLLSDAYDIGRLDPDDPEYMRRRAIAAATRRKLTVAIAEFGRACAAEAHDDVTRGVNARLWKLYHSLPEPDPHVAVDPRWRAWRASLLAEISGH